MNMSRSVTNIMEKINEITEDINNNYDMSLANMNEIYENSRESFDLISNGFKFGYLQGIKSERARQKRKEKSASKYIKTV